MTDDEVIKRYARWRLYDPNEGMFSLEELRQWQQEGVFYGPRR
jgi:polyhydroxyalkanoate synthesis regulator protein